LCIARDEALLLLPPPTQCARTAITKNKIDVEFFAKEGRVGEDGKENQSIDREKVKEEGGGGGGGKKWHM
jgi:hypothetical protein